jgi:hypothetical protein
VFFHALIVSFILLILSFSLVFPASKRLEVKTNRAEIRLKPDINSPVIETLEKGEIVSLASSRKFRRHWNYIYFTSHESGASKAGYIQDSAVFKLFKATKVNTISNPKKRRKTTNKVTSPMKNMSWGIVSERILKFEGDPQILKQMDGHRVLEYHRKVLEMLCHIHYYFSEDRLVKTEYVFPGKYVRKKWHVDDYKKIKAVLIRDYGAPEEDLTFWYNPLYRDVPSSWGDAVSLGHLEYQSRWLTPDTRVALILSGHSEQVSLELNYSSLSLQ